MGIFYINTEYTNGNFYLGDIFEITCLSNDSGYIFHSYIKIPSSIPRYIKRLCNVTDMTIQNSPSFHEVMNDLIEFISANQDSSTTTLVGHGAFLSHFPLLMTNCMKYGYDYRRFETYNFIDSVQVFQRMGYDRPGLDALSNGIRSHSAIEDVELLRDIVTKTLGHIITNNVYTLDDILQYLNQKLPVSIPELYNLANEASSYQSLEATLRRYSAAKTALSDKQLCKIACKYYYNSLL